MAHLKFVQHIGGGQSFLTQVSSQAGAWEREQKNKADPRDSVYLDGCLLFQKLMAPKKGLSMKLSPYCLLLPLCCSGCTSLWTAGTPHHLITVLDQDGKPIRGAGFIVDGPEFPQKRARPYDDPSAGTTNSRGLGYVYDWENRSEYVLDANGYFPKVVTFPQDDKQVYVLKRVHSEAAREKANTEAHTLTADLRSRAMKQQAQRAAAKSNG